MSDQGTAPALADDVKDGAMLPHSRDDDPPANLVVEVQEVTIALAGVLEEAGIKLPQFHARLAPAEACDWVVRLGDVNVRHGLAICNLLRDGLTLRQKHPEESVNAQS
ncbi:hypothetical protein ACFY2J_17125 [Streptomyces collinus]|uniref:hypothetical protein n=1 Tax=Streptomyces collinus TaxID=42684 RepID=UPI0036C464AA